MMSEEREAIVVQAKRTAVGKVGGALCEVNVEVLAATVLTELITKSALDPILVDNVVLGNVIGPGGNVARLSLLAAGLPLHVPGYTVDMQCGSGLQAIHLAAQAIRSGHGKTYLAGGVESSSRAPWKLEKPRQMYREMPQVYPRARFAPEHIGDPDMGIAAENVARKFGVTREMQDEWALMSHQRAVAAQEAGKCTVEIVPVPLGAKQMCTEDEGPRKTTTIEKLGCLQPVFLDGGTVTAGNACGINDGASAVLLLAKSLARELGYTEGLRYVDSVVVGVDPNYLGAGPIPAVEQLLHRCGKVIGDIDLIEFNEAFAAQVVACVGTLALPIDRVNVNGGAIALGHPYGASGAMLVTHLFHEIMRRGGRFGLTTMGVGGGLGVATLWEWVKL